MQRAQISALYALARKLHGEVVLVQENDRRVLVEHPSSDRQWLIDAAGSTTRL